MALNDVDVIIIGGSYAGLSAAMALGRSMRKTLIVDSGNPCNKMTPGAHNLLGQDGRSPAEITATGKREVLKYPTIEFLNDIVETAKQDSDGFELTTGKGQVLKAKKLLFATGVKDVMPQIDGFEACWGVSVLHCPYCHGYEFRGCSTAVIASGKTAFEFAELISNWTNNLCVVTNGDSDLEPTQLRALAAREIKIIETKIERLQHSDGRIECIHFEDGTSLDVEAAYARPYMEQHCELPETLGCEFNSLHIKVDQYQQTTVPGVFAAGDNCSPLRSLANAIAAGGVAGAFINKELTETAMLSNAGMSE
jgi:thioredoxin reductase